MSGEEPRGGLVGIFKARRDEVRHAVMFLTRIPVGRIERLPSLADSAWAYPIAGALHSLVIGLSYWAALLLGLSSLVSALLAVLAGFIASGAFHEDGLADCADGLGGGWTRERKLAIMRDSRIGTYGAASLFLALGLKVALIGGIDDPARVVFIVVALGALTRGFMPLAMLLLPAARTDGAAATVAGALSPGLAGISAVLGLAVALTLLTATDLWAVVATACGMGVMFLLAIRQVGGLTGDVLGAAQVVGELSGLLAIAASMSP